MVIYKYLHLAFFVVALCVCVFHVSITRAQILGGNTITQKSM